MNTSCSQAEVPLNKDEGRKERQFAFQFTGHPALNGARRALTPWTARTLPFGFRADYGKRQGAFGFCSRKCTGLLALLLTTLMAAAAPLKTGDAFPDLNKFKLEGTLSDTKGKIVLVDFFASWCGPCKESFPAMQELHKKFAGKDFLIIAINLDQKKADMDEFLKKHPADFAIVRDAANALVSAVKIPTMPTSFLLGRDGRVVSVHRGFKGEETRKKYLEEIEALLK